MRTLLRRFHSRSSGTERPITRPLRDISATELLTATDIHMLAQTRWAVRSSTMAKLHEDPDVSWAISSIPHPLFNVVSQTHFAANLSPEAIDARIDEVLSLYRSRKLPLIWWVTPLTRPADLGARLEAHGLAKADELPGMVLDLRTMHIDESAPTGLTIARPGDHTGVREWVHLFSSLAEIPSEMEPDIATMFERATLGPTSPMRLYTGRLNGAPVATATLTLAEGLAGIYSVATVSEARRRGIGAALTLAALLDARTMGYRIAILQSSAMGHELYRRLGFQDYCAFTLYLWAPEGDSPEEP